MPGGVGGDLDDSRIEADYGPFRKGNRAVRKPTCDSVPRNRLRVKRIIPTFSNVPLPFSTRTPSPRGRRGVTRRRWQQFRRAFNRLRQEVERGWTDSATRMRGVPGSSPGASTNISPIRQRPNSRAQGEPVWPGLVQESDLCALVASLL
jgi:hypothetical protein